jgi:hypothetical protein
VTKIKISIYFLDKKFIQSFKACFDHQHAFILFAFDIFDFLPPEIVSLLQRVQNIINNNGVSPRAMNVVFKRIDFTIQKG